MLAWLLFNSLVAFVLSTRLTTRIETVWGDLSHVPKYEADLSKLIPGTGLVRRFTVSLPVDPVFRAIPTTVLDDLMNFEAVSPAFPSGGDLIGHFRLERCDGQMYDRVRCFYKNNEEIGAVDIRRDRQGISLLDICVSLHEKRAIILSYLLH